MSRQRYGRVSEHLITQHGRETPPLMRRRLSAQGLLRFQVINGDYVNTVVNAEIISKTTKITALATFDMLFKYVYGALHLI